MCEKVAKAAAKWWIEQMKKKCTSLCPDRIIKDRTGFLIIDDSLSEEFERFENALVGQLQDSLKKSRYVYLGCCYSPDLILLEAAKISEIPSTYFPIHADMQIYDTSIFVSIGEADSHELCI